MMSVSLYIGIVGELVVVDTTRMSCKCILHCVCMYVSLHVLRRCCLSSYDTEGLQEVMQREHADIRSRQEHQLQVTEQGHAAILSRQKVIQSGQEHQLVVTEQVLAGIQGLMRGQEATSCKLEPRGRWYPVCEFLVIRILIGEFGLV